MLKKKICTLSKLKNESYIKLWIKEFKDEIIIFINNNKIYVKSSICPHLGGTINYIKNQEYLYCDWHGLKFSTNGKCLNQKNFKKCLDNYDHEITKNNIYVYKNENS
jgi:nitrite reductase/ring-hydroxylating ferredoxin subunit